jgi:prephenate dehydrogenase
VPTDLNDPDDGGSGDHAGDGSDVDADSDRGPTGDPDADSDPDPDPSAMNRAAGGRVGINGSLLVVGAGTVGRWIARVLDAEDTAFRDTDPEAARTAADSVGGRVVGIDSEERFDVVGIAVPIPAATEAIATHAPRADRAIFDATGTMHEPVAAMAEHAPDVERVSLHPLFAPERAPGNVAVVASGDAGLTSAERGGESVAAGIDAALRAAGNEPFVTTPEKHDQAMETVQARAHVAVLAFALAAEPIDERFHTPVSRALSAVAARVADGSPTTYAEIQTAFEGSEDVAAAAARLAEASDEEFEALYREAGESP